MCAMAMVTYRECRAAARSVRLAEFGRTARRAARPVSVLGVVRGRGPIPVLLYVAGREGRLVWRSADEFAVLEPPIEQRSGLLAGDTRLSLVRIVDRGWEQLIMFVPPVLSLLLALLLVLVAPKPVDPVLLLVIVALPALAILHIAVLLTCSVVTGGRSLFGLGRRDETVELASGANWHVQLCHQATAARADALLRRAADRLADLVTERIRHAGSPMGGQVVSVRVTETLAFLMPAVTTDAMRAAIRTASRAESPYGPDGDVVVLCLDDSARPPVRKSPDKGAFVFYYLAAIAVMIVVQAWIVAGWERSTYGITLRWLAYRLLFSQAGGLTPTSGYTWSIGWLDSIAGLMALPVVYRSFGNLIAARKDRLRLFDESVARVTTQTKVLILVAKQLERDAVRDAVLAVNGKPMSRRFEDRHTVFDLDLIDEVRVLLAQSGRQGTAGMMYAADDVIKACRPDYVILTGVCYGLWDIDASIGDVIVSQTVHDIDSRKVIDGADGQVVKRRGDRVPAGDTLLDRFNAATMEWREPPRIVSAPMLSSNTLVDSVILRDELRKEFDNAAGGDMEGAAVCAAAARAKVDWIVVKGISDLGMNVTSEHQKLAARNAAEFVVHTIALGGLRPPSS